MTLPNLDSSHLDTVGNRLMEQHVLVAVVN